MTLINTKQVMDVDLDHLTTLSVSLAEKIQKAGYIPNHILYIERAGILTGLELADFFNCPVSGITSQRSGNSFKSRIKLILRLLPRFITHTLRRLEINSSVHKVNSDRNISCKEALPATNKKILVVDDALDTGHSMDAVLTWLTGRGFKKELIKTAVLTTTGEALHIKADFSLLKGVICAFPWSYDSRQYHETKKKMQAARQHIEAGAAHPKPRISVPTLMPWA